MDKRKLYCWDCGMGFGFHLSGCPSAPSEDDAEDNLDEDPGLDDRDNEQENDDEC